MELQHIQIKVYASTPDALYREHAPIVRAFHRWIQQNVTDELLIDVADYSHVPAGPGIILMGHDAFYSVEPGPENRVGLLYGVKTLREGSNADRIAHSVNQALAGARRLAQEPGWTEPIDFATRELLLIANDRLLTPNTAASFEALKSDWEAATATVPELSGARAEYLADDPRERLRLRIRLTQPLSLGTPAVA
ncbi:MAG: hypothetical protein KDK34_04115 [Leptospiraceae bacterium]|nr:hypothetical protein [Leptospiraceae bacterium]